MQRGSVQEINPARSSDQRHSRGRKRQPLPLASFPGLHRSYCRSTNNFSGASLVPRPIPISDEPGNETIIQDPTKLFPPRSQIIFADMGKSRRSSTTTNKNSRVLPILYECYIHQYYPPFHSLLSQPLSPPFSIVSPISISTCVLHNVGWQHTVCVVHNVFILASDIALRWRDYMN